MQKDKNFDTRQRIIVDRGDRLFDNFSLNVRGERGFESAVPISVEVRVPCSVNSCE